MNRFIFAIFFILNCSATYGQAIPFDNDCRDLNGDLIADCTCTNINGDIVSCTDGEIIVPCCPPPPPPGGGGSNPGNDGVDNDGDGLVDEADEYSFNQDGERVSGRVPVINPSSVPLGINVTINSDRFVYYIFQDDLPQFDVMVQYLWSRDIGSFKEGDIVSLQIKRLSDNSILRNEIDYTRVFGGKGNYAWFTVFLLPEAISLGQDSFEVKVSVNKSFEKSDIIELKKKVVSYDLGPLKRNVTYRRIGIDL